MDSLALCDNGGELCAHCRTQVASHAPAGAHEGNLQVGWLDGGSATGSAPVYLDAWLREAAPADDADGRRWRPRSALYTLRADGGREYLTGGFGPDSATWPQATMEEATEEAGMAPEAFYEALRAQLPTAELRAAFSSVEALWRPGQQTVEVAPVGGTLVLFDSASVPHSVKPTRAGKRLALAGWLHEEAQGFPEWFGM